MSTVQRVRILDYLPPEEKQKVLTLVTRLREETEAKEKYMGLYQQTQRQLDQITSTCNLLKDQNKQLKQQIHNSFSMVSQLRSQFHSNQQKRSQPLVHPDKDWEDLSEQDDHENQPNEGNHTQTLKRPPRSNAKSPLEKYRPPMMTDKKSPPLLNLSTSELSQTQLSGSRSRQIMDLRQQVRVLQEQKRKKEEKDLEMKQKMKLIDEIKNRYRTGEERSQDSSRPKDKTIQRIDISDTFEQQQAKTMYSNQKSTRVRSNEKPKNDQKMHLQVPSKYSEYQKISVPRVKEIIQPKKMKEQKKPALPPEQGYRVTADDYSDVLDMINDYN